MLPVLTKFWEVTQPLIIAGLHTLLKDVFAPLFTFLWDSTKDRTNRVVGAALAPYATREEALGKISGRFKSGSPEHIAAEKLRAIENERTKATENIERVKLAAKKQLSENTITTPSSAPDGKPSIREKTSEDRRQEQAKITETLQKHQSILASLPTRLETLTSSPEYKSIVNTPRVGSIATKTAEGIRKSLSSDIQRQSDHTGTPEPPVPTGIYTPSGYLEGNKSADTQEYLLKRYDRRLFVGLKASSPEMQEYFSGGILTPTSSKRFIRLRQGVVNALNQRDNKDGIGWTYQNDGSIIPYALQKGAFAKLYTPYIDKIIPDEERNPNYNPGIHESGGLGTFSSEPGSLPMGVTVPPREKINAAVSIAADKRRQPVVQHMEDGIIRFSPSDRPHAAGGGKEQVMAKDGGVLDVKLEAIRTTLVEKLNRVEETAEKKTQELYKVLSGITGVLNGIREFLPELTPYPPTPPQQQTTQFDNLHEYRLKSFVALT
jgi:hypothetical protein